MGYDAECQLQRKVTLVDAETIKTRVQVLLCSRSDACPLTPVIMECIARMVKGEPVGGDLWVQCPNDQCAVLSPARWRELLILYQAQLAKFEECYRSQFEADDSAEDDSCCWDPWELAACCSATTGKKHSTKDFTYHMIEGRNWDLHQLLSETGARPPADKVVSVLTCMLPGLPADLFYESASASSISHRWYSSRSAGSPEKSASASSMIGGSESTISKQSVMEPKPSVIERITGRNFASMIDNGICTPFAYTVDDGNAHSHTHCYLDGLLSVDWDVDARSEVRGGYTHAVETAQLCCYVCQGPIPAVHRTDCHGCMRMWGTILRKRVAERTQTESWTGPLAGSTRRDYLDAAGDDVRTILRFGAKLKKNGVPAENLRMLICFNG